MAEYSHPPLTTLHQPVYQIGEKVCEMLIQRLAGATLKEDHIILRPRLVIRQSSGGAGEQGSEGAATEIVAWERGSGGAREQGSVAPLRGEKRQSGG
jgi:hypothetical protein